jgi:hypothetical protein
MHRVYTLVTRPALHSELSSKGWLTARERSASHHGVTSLIAVRRIDRFIAFPCPRNFLLHWERFLASLTHVIMEFDNVCNWGALKQPPLLIGRRPDPVAGAFAGSQPCIADLAIVLPVGPPSLRIWRLLAA